MQCSRSISIGLNLGHEIIECMWRRGMQNIGSCGGQSCEGKAKNWMLAAELKVKYLRWTIGESCGDADVSSENLWWCVGERCQWLRWSVTVFVMLGVWVAIYFQLPGCRKKPNFMKQNSRKSQWEHKRPMQQTNWAGGDANMRQLRNAITVNN